MSTFVFKQVGDMTLLKIDGAEVHIHIAPAEEAQHNLLRRAESMLTNMAVRDAQEAKDVGDWLKEMHEVLYLSRVTVEGEKEDDVCCDKPGVRVPIDYGMG